MVNECDPTCIQNMTTCNTYLNYIHILRLTENYRRFNDRYLGEIIFLRQKFRHQFS